MTYWEYYTATWANGLLGGKWTNDDLRKLGFYDGLDSLGKVGWELVAAVPSTLEGDTKDVEYIFKRPIG